jgi:replicative DNA helicase Mcm
LLSRFDLIFGIRDKPNKETDERIARHIVGTHRAGEMHMVRRQNANSQFTEAQERVLMARVQPVIPERILRKYVAYAKRNYFPVLTEEAADKLRLFYQELRGQQGAIAITPRQIEALIRLTEASARLHLSTEAGVDDAERAINIFKRYLHTVGWNDEAGTFDIDIIAAGASSSQQDRMRRILEIVRRLNAESGGEGAKRGDIEKEAAGSMPTIPGPKVEEALKILLERGSIYQPRSDRFEPV